MSWIIIIFFYNFPCLLFYVKLSWHPHFTFYLRTTQTTYYLTNPIWSHYLPTNSFVSDLAYTICINLILWSNLNYKRLQKYVYSIILLTMNLNNSVKNVPVLSPYLFLTQTARLLKFANTIKLLCISLIIPQPSSFVIQQSHILAGYHAVGINSYINQEQNQIQKDKYQQFCSTFLSLTAIGDKS